MQNKKQNETFTIPGMFDLPRKREETEEVVQDKPHPDAARIVWEIIAERFGNGDKN